MKSTSLISTLAMIVTLTIAVVDASAKTEPRIEVKITPAPTVEERVANEVKAKDLKKAAEEKQNAEEAAKILETSPKALLSHARILFIRSNTDSFEAV